MAFRQNTPEWEDARRDTIGSSDIPVITGSRPGKKVALWAVKSRRAEPEPIDPETQELFDLGHALEPVIAAQFTRNTGIVVKSVHRMLRHRSIEWATASLDRAATDSGERVAVELKWAPFSRDWSGPEPVPAMVQDQVQWQLLVTGWRRAFVVVLRDGHVEYHEIIADPSYQADELFLAREFRGYVERGEMPPLDGSEATRKVLTRLYPRELGTITEPTLEIDALVADLRIAKRAAAEADEREAKLKNVLRAVLETAPGVEGDGYRIHFTKNKGGETVAWQPVAAAYRELLIQVGQERASTVLVDQVDAIQSLYTTPKEGARPLVVKYRDEETGKWS